jgi:hypothetical protein
MVRFFARQNNIKREAGRAKNIQNTNNKQLENERIETMPSQKYFWCAI